MADVFDGAEFVCGSHRVACATGTDAAGGEADVILGNGVYDLHGRETQVLELVGVNGDYDLLFNFPDDKHRRHTFDATQARLDDIVNQSLEAGYVLVSRDRELHDGKLGGGNSADKEDYIVRQSCAGDGALNITLGLFHVGVEVECR